MNEIWETIQRNGLVHIVNQYKECYTFFAWQLTFDGKDKVTDDIDPWAKKAKH